MQKDESSAADARAIGLHHRQSRRDGDRRIERVTARGENFVPCFRGEWMCTRDRGFARRAFRGADGDDRRNEYGNEDPTLEHQARRCFFNSAATIGCTNLPTSPPRTAISRTREAEMNENASCGVRNTVSMSAERCRLMLA